MAGVLRVVREVERRQPEIGVGKHDAAEEGDDEGDREDGECESGTDAFHVHHPYCPPYVRSGIVGSVYELT